MTQQENELVRMIGVAFYWLSLAAGLAAAIMNHLPLTIFFIFVAWILLRPLSR